MFSYADVARLPEYGRDETAWAAHSAEVVRRSAFGGCVTGMAVRFCRWLDEEVRS